MTGFHISEAWKKYFEADLERLNLESLEKGYDSLQIRFWISHGYNLRDTSQLIIIKKNEVKYSGVVLFYPESPEDISSASVKVISPKSGWEKFYEKLETKDILGLPNYSELENYHLSSDAFGVTIEFATKKTYRIFAYPNYEAHYKNFDEAKKIYEAMQFLEAEFGLKTIY